MKVLVLHGPNLNALGHREPQLYGSSTLNEINHSMADLAVDLNVGLECFQSNHEGELVSWIQEARGKMAGIAINAAAYTHTSVALLDALSLVELPIIEIHLSNVYARDSFRHHSYISPVANGVICGLGSHGYLLALDALKRIIDSSAE